MLFRRRTRQTFGQKLRVWLWPTRSWGRSLRHVRRRVLRLRATPHAIAAGFAAGVFAAFTPFLGLHFLIAFALAWCIAGNMAAAALGTVAGNPVTFPFIWASTLETGRYIIAADVSNGVAPLRLHQAFRQFDLAAIWTPYLKPMLVGSIPIGALGGLVAYGIVYLTSRSFQNARSKRLLVRRLGARQNHGAAA